MTVEAVRTAVPTQLYFYLSIFICSLTNHTAQQRDKKQWNRTYEANSSYSRPKKRKTENESSYNKYQQVKLTIYTTDLHAYT